MCSLEDQCYVLQFCYLLTVLLQHVPKTNGDIPSFDEAFSDHRRLLDKLVLYGLVI